MASKKTNKAKKQTQKKHDETSAASTNNPALNSQSNHAGLFFGGLTLLVTWLLPAAELKLDTWSFASIILNYAELPSQVTTSFPTIVPLAIIPICAVYAMLPFIFSKIHVSFLEKHERSFLFGLAPLIAFPALHTYLFSQSDKVKLVFATGYYGYIFVSFALFVYVIYLFYQRDNKANNTTQSSEIIMALSFGFLLFLFAMINYKYVNYELIPKATEILPTLSKQ